MCAPSAPSLGSVAMLLAFLIHVNRFMLFDLRVDCDVLISLQKEKKCLKMFSFCVCLLVNECVTLLQSNILYKEASFSVFMRLQAVKLK